VDAVPQIYISFRCLPSWGFSSCPDGLCFWPRADSSSPFCTPDLPSLRFNYSGPSLFFFRVPLTHELPALAFCSPSVKMFISSGFRPRFSARRTSQCFLRWDGPFFPLACVSCAPRRQSPHQNWLGWSRGTSACLPISPLSPSSLKFPSSLHSSLHLSPAAYFNCAGDLPPVDFSSTAVFFGPLHTATLVQLVTL